MKLNLVVNTPFPRPKSEVCRIDDIRKIKPVGWWRVTTEADCEGRHTHFCGDYYGHVAEIVLSVPSIPYYRYSVEWLNRPPLEIAPVYKAVRSLAPVAFDHDMFPMAWTKNKTWWSHEIYLEEVKKFLDTDDVVLSIGQYGQVDIRLKDFP